MEVKIFELNLDLLLWEFNHPNTVCELLRFLIGYPRDKIEIN